MNKQVKTMMAYPKADIHQSRHILLGVSLIYKHKIP